MFVPTCRGISRQNLSNLTFLFSLVSSNITTSHSSTKLDIEWLITSISSLIFLLAVLGNGAALIVMFGSRGPIRLTNNKYLVNLACADLLRASFMPFTIIARMKKNFMFGPIICKILPIVQGLSVAVDIFTLVCISVERYLAICRPLLILKLQSLQFSNVFNGLILFFIWTIALLTALPNIFMYNLCSFPKLRTFKCEKVHPVYFDERFYMVGLLLFYFLAPMLIMIVLYTLIICKMYKNNTAMKMRSFHSKYPSKTLSISSNPPAGNHSYETESTDRKSSNTDYLRKHVSDLSTSRTPRYQTRDDEQLLSKQQIRMKSNSYHGRRRSFWKFSNSRESSRRSQSSTSNPNVYRMDRHRRKALKLLIVIIMEFFICWTPLFLFHTLDTFNKNFYRLMPKILVDIVLLFSFASLLCNPFTYYFMSKRYRTVLYAYLSCCSCCCLSRNDNEQKLSKTNEEARQLIRALRLHQQQNSVEYQLKHSLSNDHRPRSNTLH